MTQTERIYSTLYPDYVPLVKHVIKYRIQPELRREIAARGLWEHFLSDVYSVLVTCREPDEVYRAAAREAHRFIMSNGWRIHKVWDVDTERYRQRFIPDDGTGTKSRQWRHERSAKRCEYCGKQYVPTGNYQRFCTVKCKNNWYYHNVRKVEVS